MATGDTLLVAAIDFGTTYFGWAFSFKHEFDNDPTIISTMKWSGRKLTSLKGPTCVLIQPDGKTFDKFGFEAETGDHKRWFYFHRFKMMLWNKQIHKDTMLVDEHGKSLPAITVFSLSIRYLMGSLMKTSKQQVSGPILNDVHWVLTVPAIWNDSAKHFMRLAAQEAGISSEKLSIALEPEAASLYCRQVPVQKDGCSGVASFQSGTNYLVLDAGGGTIDITIHEVCPGGELKEVYKATGGAWGGTMVDKAFLDFVAQLIGQDILQKFREDHMEDYIDLMRDFEGKKRETDFKSDGRVTIRFPMAISELLDEIKGQELKQLIQTSIHSNKISLVSDKLRIETDIFRSFFKGSVDCILQNISDVLKQPETSGVDTILMVGGYSESPLLREAIQNNFSTMKIIVPQDAGLAVLKGAVIYGHSPTLIKERVSKYTYGTETSHEFETAEHPLEKRKLCDTGYRCINIFSTLVKSGEKLVVGEKKYVGEFFNIEADQTSMEFNLFYTTNKDVKFITDDGCYKIGSVTVPISGKGLKRYVTVRIMFGGTEILFEFEEKSTGIKTTTLVDFLL